MKPDADVIASVDRYTDKTLKIMSLMSKFDMADREDVELRPWEQGKLDVNRRPVPPLQGHRSGMHADFLTKNLFQAPLYHHLAAIGVINGEFPSVSPMGGC